MWISEKMKSWFETKVRALLGPEEGDDKHVVILGRHERWTADGIEYEADPKHRKLLMEHVGFDEESSSLFHNAKKIGGMQRHVRRRNCQEKRRRFFVESRRGQTF